MEPRLQPPHHEDRISRAGQQRQRSVNVPAQVCKFLVDSLQRHVDGVVCWCVVGRVVVVVCVESLRILVAQQTREVEVLESVLSVCTGEVSD